MINNDAIRITISILVIGIIIGLLFWGVVKSEMQWQEYAVKHCKVVGRTSSSVGMASGYINGNGYSTGTVYIPGKTSYLCDDGITYTR